MAERAQSTLQIIGHSQSLSRVQPVNSVPPVPRQPPSPWKEHFPPYMVSGPMGRQSFPSKQPPASPSVNPSKTGSQSSEQ